MDRRAFLALAPLAAVAAAFRPESEPPISIPYASTEGIPDIDPAYPHVVFDSDWTAYDGGQWTMTSADSPITTGSTIRFARGYVR